jgi:hypothetical protein
MLKQQKLQAENFAHNNKKGKNSKLRHITFFTCISMQLFNGLKFKIIGHTDNCFVELVEMSDDEVVAELRREHYSCEVEVLRLPLSSLHVTDG